ncbi:MAG TPA: hypothetical protein VMF69_08290 [Gemmataceae bacterium]|nr:hypothetical protein [Gemmataceae bacterium]
MRTWMRLIPAVVLILPFAPALLNAADPEIPIKKEDFQKLMEKVDKLQSDMTANSLRGNRTADDLRAIREELQRIRELLERMAQQQGAIQRQSGYGPTFVPPGAPPSTGTITLRNVYSAPATVHINGQPHLVLPNQTRIVSNFPVGSFRYSVDVDGFGMVEPPRTETLHPAGYRITIFPRMPY